MIKDIFSLCMEYFRSMDISERIDNNFTTGARHKFGLLFLRLPETLRFICKFCNADGRRNTSIGKGPKQFWLEGVSI